MGAARGRPGGGRLLPGCGASGVGRCPSPRRPSMGQAAGARSPFSVGTGGVGVGIRHQPYSSRSCELALRAVGAAHERPEGDLFPGCGASGVGRSPSPSPLSMGQAAGPAARFPWAGRVRVWEPITNPTASALASWLCAAWGRHMGARGGTSFLGVRRPGLGALPSPAARPWGRRPGPAARFPLAREV